MFASSDAKPSVWHCEPSFASGFRATSFKSNCISERLTAGRGVCCRGRDAQTEQSVSDVSHYHHRSGGASQRGRDPQITAESGADSDVKHTVAKRGIKSQKRR